MKDNLWEHMHGTDASNEISLLEYGLLVAPGEVVNPEQCEPEGEYFCVYRIGDDAFGTGYIKDRELNDIIDGKEWATDEGVVSFLGYVDAEKEEWKTRDFAYKLAGLISYWGYENIMGTDYSPMTQDEAMERYLGPDYALGQYELLVDDNRGIYCPQAFAEMYGHLVVPDEDCEGMIEQDLGTLKAGPDEEGYWDAMEEIERNAMLKIGDKLFDIEQDGDIWAYEHGKRRPAGHDGE